MKKSFFYNTLLLTITTQALRIAGIAVIAYLSGKIGTEGIGLYQLICSVYFLIATMATSGLSISVTRLTAEAIGKSGYQSTSNVLKKCIGYGLFLSISVMVLVFSSAGFIGNVLLHDGRTVLSIKILSAGLPFMAISSCLRGYFYGLRKVFKPASEMIFEEIVHIVIMVSILDRFIPKGLDYACFAIMFANVAAEVLSFLYSFTLYKLEKRRSRLKVIHDPKIERKIFSIFLPVAASSYLRSGLRTAENILIPLGLKQFGASHKDALSQYGLLIGMVMPLLLFPSAFLSAIATLLIPEITEAHTLKNYEKVQRTVSRVFKLTLVLSLLFCGIFTFFSYDIGFAVYQNREAGGLLMLLSPLVPLIYLDFLVDGMLNGLNQQIRTLKINILDYSIRIMLLLVLIPRYGLIAFIGILYFSTVLNSFLSIYSLVKVSRIKVRLIDWIVKPLLSVLSAASVSLLLFHFLPGGSLPVALTIKIILTVALYICFLFMVRCLKSEDVHWFKAQVKRSRLKKENHFSGEQAID